jgi:hypothetical protein
MAVAAMIGDSRMPNAGAALLRPQDRPPLRHPGRRAQARWRAVRADRRPWRNNFRGGADVEVTLDGHVTRIRGQLLDDPEAVAPLYAGAIDHFGVKRAQRMLGLKIHTPGTPATEALAEAARRYHLCAIRLTVRT